MFSGEAALHPGGTRSRRPERRRAAEEARQLREWLDRHQQPGAGHPRGIWPVADRLRRWQFERNPVQRTGGARCVERPSLARRTEEDKAGRRQRPLPLLQHGPRPSAVDGRHHPTDEHTGETQVCDIPCHKAISIYWLVDAVWCCNHSNSCHTLTKE